MGFRSRLQNFFSRSLNDPSTSFADPANWFWTALGAPGSTSGVATVPETALEVMSVLSAVKLISGTMASLPLLTYRSTDQGKDRAPSHAAYKILKDKANPELSAFAWREISTAHVLCYGNAYSELEWSQNGSLLNIWPIYPAYVRPTRVDGKLAYHVRVGGDVVTLPADRMLHIRGFGMQPQEGLLTTYLAREALGLAKATEKYGASFFGNGAQPSGVLTHPGKLSKQARDNLKSGWNTMYQGLSNAQRVAILEEGLTFQPLGIPPEHAQFLATREFTVAEVARIFNIPAHMLASLDRATFASLEQQSQEFVTYCLTPLCKRFEAEFGLKIFDDTPFFAEFQLNGLLRGDSAARAAYYTQMLNNGVLSVNEVRALENLNSIGPEGDQHLRPLNETPLGQPVKTNDE